MRIMFCMHYRYTSSSWSQKSMCISSEDFPSQMTKSTECKISIREVVLWAKAGVEYTKMRVFIKEDSFYFYWQSWEY